MRETKQLHVDNVTNSQLCRWDAHGCDQAVLAPYGLDACGGSNPSTSTSLVRPRDPATTRTAEGGVPAQRATTRTSAALAAPATAGAVTQTWRTLSTHSTRWWRAPGWTRSWMRTVAA